MEGGARAEMVWKGVPEGKCCVGEGSLSDLEGGGDFWTE